MNLGSILSSTPGEPCASREVEFFLLKQTAQGRQRFRVKGALLPVGEADRLAARRDALAYLRTLPEYAERDGVSPPIPQSAVEQETVYKFLQQALHDPDNLLAKLIDSASYGAFRSGILAETVQRLIKAYDTFIAQEYPESADLAQLEEQALGE